MLVQALEALKIRVFSLSVVTAMAVLLVTASPALAKKKAAAAPAPRAMTPMDIATMESVGEIAISPDGNTFAFVRRVGREPLKEKDGGSWTRLAMIGKNGELRTYMGGNINVGSLSFTPNGKEVAFLSKRGDDKNRALYTMPVNGGEAMKVAEHSEGIQSYSFHPDGSKVALVAVEKSKTSVSDMTKKGFNARVFEESAKNSVLWIARVAAREEKAAEPTKISLSGSVSSIHWSPNGKFISLGLAPSSLVDDSYMFRAIRIVDAVKGKIVGKISNEGKLGKMAWSPDSAHIAFMSGEDINDPSEGRLLMAPAKGGKPVNILPSLQDGSVQDFQWLSGSELIAILNKGVETSVVRVNATEKTQNELIPAGKAIFGSLELSSSGATMALSGQTPRHPSELYSWSAESGLEQKTFHNPWLNDVAFGKQEVVQYSARDGVELEGILIHPTARRGAQKVPLIMAIHGGPESHFRNGWLTYYSIPGQMAAANGYAVFYPNYRGSTGRGVEFSKLSQGDPAGREFDDIVDAIDHLAATGLINKKKVGITGGSYGGYASAWGATYYSNRFAASVMFVGISDLVSKIGTTDIPKEMYNVHFRFWPWDKWNEILRRSPIYYAHQSRTPTLILHGDSDTRVDPGQSKELYRHLKLRGKAATRLVLYPGEGHGNRRAASRLDYSIRMLRWFEHFLKGNRTAAPDYEIDYKKAIGAEEEK